MYVFKDIIMNCKREERGNVKIIEGVNLFPYACMALSQ
jgi:hypothetical protein